MASGFEKKIETLVCAPYGTVSYKEMAEKLLTPVSSWQINKADRQLLSDIIGNLCAEIDALKVKLERQV